MSEFDGLHPLARQAIVLSSKADCSGWAFGLTKYLAFRDPLGCLRWTLDFVMPHVQATGNDVAQRTVGLLEGVLAEPNQVSLHEMDEFVWIPWAHRLAVKGAGPLARLVWAAMGAVVLAQHGNPPSSELPSLFHGEEGPKTKAEGVVWDQCATAIQMLGYDNPTIPMEVAAFFTKSVCRTTPPAEFTVLRNLKGAGDRLAFEIAILQDNDGAFHLRYDNALFSGPFASMTEVEERIELLKHKPTFIRLASTNDPTFISTIQAWIELKKEVFALIQFHASAGSKSFEFFHSVDAFKSRFHELPPRTRITVFRDPQLPLRGCVNEDFIQKALAAIPDGAEFLLVALEMITMGKGSWFHDAAGVTHDELVEALRHDYCYGKQVAVGHYPPWLDQNDSVISAVVPNEDGSVTTGMY